MRCHFYLLWIFVIIWQPTLCFYNLCDNSKNKILSNEECSDLYFESTEKTNDFGRVKVEIEQSSFKITPEAPTWTDSFVKITVRSNATNSFCSKLPKMRRENFYCFNFTPDMENQTLLVEYKIEKLPEISYRKILFSLPNFTEMPLFLYIDQTDMSQLVLKAQKLPNFTNVSYYKVEAYKEKNGNANLQDLKHFSSQDEIYYELFTYNDVGQYYFVVWVMGDHCGTDNICLKIATPKILIGRKGTRVVIGIVGASFILPFILFVFHILTKKYPVDENVAKSEERLVVAYKSSSNKHNEVVLTLAALLENMGNLVVDVIDLSKATKKFPQKFCVDSLIIANRIVYVAPPKNDLNPILIDKTLSEKDILVVVFEHCTDKLPQFFDVNKTFKLFEDFDKLINVLNISGECNKPLYDDLVRKTEDAKLETDDSLPGENLPQIIITESEPQEHDSLIAEKVIL